MGLTSRHGAIASRLASAAYLLVLAALFVAAARFRFAMPLPPLSDPDTWGYLHPALQKLLTGNLVHTYGRSFPYPLFIYGCIAAAGTFSAISVVQHVLGLASAVVMLAAWHRVARFFPLTAIETLVHRAIGVVMLIAYLFAKTSLLMEHSIRPEAIFPFFTILAVWLAVEYCLAFYRRKNLRAAWWLGASLIFDSLFIYFLKPAWGFGAGFAMLPVLLSLFQIRGHPLYKVSVVTVPLALVAATLWYPERVLAERYDPGAERFLPELLFIFNGHAMRRELAADLESAAPPYGRNLLAMVAESFDLEFQANHRRYKGLDYDPDNLLYRHDPARHCLVEILNDYFKDDTAAFNRFCIGYYERGWRHQPGAMLGKVLGQLGTYYLDTNKSFDNSIGGSVIEMAASAKRTLDALPEFKTPCAPLDDYRRISASFLESEKEFWQPPAVSRMHKTLSRIYPALLVLVLGSAVWLWPRRGESGAPVAPLLWALFGLSLNFGNCLTVAIVHTISVSRYTKNQLVFTLFAMGTAALFLVVLARWIAARRWREEQSALAARELANGKIARV